MKNKLNWSQDDIDRLLKGIFIGKVTTRKLPKDLYYSTAYVLKKAVYKGYKATPTEFDFGTPNELTIQALRENVYMFSAAKTYQQVEQMSSMLVEDGATVPFSEFKKKASALFDTMNDAYLATEHETAVGQAESASKWVMIEDDKSVLPWLEYDAILDSSTSPVCAELNGVTLPVGDPFWNTHAPLNHFRCRCRLKQISKFDNVQVTPKKEVKEIDKKATELTNPAFRMNPGRTHEVFSKKHPYFMVPKKDKEFAKRNFDLSIPKKD